MADFQGVEWFRESSNGTVLSTLGVYRVPTRKSIALCTTEGSVCHVLAYFRDEESANKTIETLRKFIPSQSAPPVRGAK